MNKKHLFLLLGVLIIIAIPFTLKGDFTGTDDAASAEIQKTGYTPWFKSIWEPSSEQETLIFAIQAIIGLIIIGCFFGYYRKKQSF